MDLEEAKRELGDATALIYAKRYQEAITNIRMVIRYLESAQPRVQRTATPHEHLQAEFDYICAGCGELVKRRR